MKKEKREKTQKKITGFFEEFKKFITRGNVLDMAVGVVVGGAFTAIVTAITTHIVRPLTDWVLASIFNKDSQSELYSFLKKIEVDGKIDLGQSIYIDWGACFTAIFNFFIIAFVLFCLIKTINNIRENAAEARAKKLSREDRRVLRERGVKFISHKVKKAYLAEKKAEAERIAKEKAEAEALAAAQYKAEHPTAEELLAEIRDLLKNGR